jgi:hypothetical protein
MAEDVWGVWWSRIEDTIRWAKLKWDIVVMLFLYGGICSICELEIVLGGVNHSTALLGVAKTVK